MTMYFLMIHLAGFALFTGTLVADIFLHKQLRSWWKTNATIASTLLETAVRHSRIMGISLGITLLAGILIMTQMHRVYGSQWWIQIKIILVVLLLACRIGTTRSINHIKKERSGITNFPTDTPNKRISQLQITQIILVAAIILLSVKKFN